MPLWLLAVPMNATTWGFSPLISNFAAAHSGCSCDPHDATVNLTYRVTVSLAFTVMPLAGLVSYLLPCHNLSRLSLLAAVQMAAFMLILSASLEADFMSCSPPARVVLAASVVTMRGVDT